MRNNSFSLDIGNAPYDDDEDDDEDDEDYVTEGEHVETMFLPSTCK